MDFDTAFTQLVGNEGGYTVDNGGPTRYGISQRSYPGEDIQNLTLDRAKFLYRRDFWGPAGCDALPDLLKFDVFDLAVNTSAPGNCKTAIRILQKAAGMPDYEQDGVIGSRTLMVISGVPPWRLMVRLIGARIAYYTHLRADLWAEDGRGWMNRVSNNALRL